MEQRSITKEIKLACVTAPLFPQGLTAAFDELKAKLPEGDARDFYGVSYGNGKGGIIYKAAAALNPGEEAAQYGLEAFTVPEGEYLTETIRDWHKTPQAIGSTFQQMLADPRLDPDGFCLERYTGQTDVECMVKIK